MKIKNDCERRHLRGCRGCPFIGQCIKQNKGSKQ